MDIQGYILDHWIGKMSAEHPVLMVYDKEGIYYDLLPMLQEKGVKVIDTTQSHLHARLSAQRYWCKDLSLNKENRMVIYRKRSMPNNSRLWVEEPYAASQAVTCFWEQLEPRAQKLIDLAADFQEDMVKSEHLIWNRIVDDIYNEKAEEGSDLRAVIDRYISVGIVRNIS